jgi:hypothetical protein
MHGEPASATADAQGVRCHACSALFVPKKAWQVHCSARCRNEWHKWTRPQAVREARELVRLALNGMPSLPDWEARARKLLGIK